MHEEAVMAETLAFFEVPDTDRNREIARKSLHFRHALARRYLGDLKNELLSLPVLRWFRR